jgi:hypothetical protein
MTVGSIHHPYYHDHYYGDGRGFIKNSRSAPSSSTSTKDPDFDYDDIDYLTKTMLVLTVNQDLSESSSSSDSLSDSSSSTTANSSSDYDDEKDQKDNQQQSKQQNHHRHHHNTKIRMPKLKKKSYNATCNTSNTHKYPFYETQDEATRRIRKQYLSRLGFAASATTATSSKQRQQVKSILKKKRGNKASQKTSIGCRGVTFRDDHNKHKHIVSSVHMIPSRYEYTKEIQRQIWMKGNEYDYTVVKNTIEYMAEGCNPDHVLEEDRFIWYNDLLIHPVHLLDF